jgi:hypothetical protein
MHLKRRRFQQMDAGWEPQVRIKTEFALLRLCEASHKRKNYLHLGSDAGGERAAVIYSLLGTAKLNGLNPRAYLRHVLDRIAEHPINRIDELLPWAVAGQINAAIAEQRLAA